MKGKNILGLLLALIIISASLWVAYNGVGEKSIAGAESVKLGLDLAGGVSITYEAVKENPTAQEISDTIYKLQKRLDEKGYTEGEVYKEGDNRVNVDIPGATDANKVLEELGKPGNLEFIDEAGTVVLSGMDVKTASVASTPADLSSPFKVILEMNDAGQEKFAQATAANIGKRIAIVYNDVTLMAPTVQSEITEGNAEISGLASVEEADDLASSIRIGALPLELSELRSNVVGAKLGQDAVTTSLLAGMIGFILIFVFMILYYRLPGLAANLALAFYAALMLMIISLGKITLTLPGIAGIILSIGMAVDANVIIFSRIREELALEKTLRASVKGGYKKAFSAILDGNLTTLIAAVVLYIFGTGTIKGFAVTLGLGIIISMFTALFVSHFIMNIFVGLGLTSKKLYGLPWQMPNMRIVENRKKFFAVSIVIIAIGLAKLPVNYFMDGAALTYDIDFVGGTSTMVTLPDGKGYETKEALETDLMDLVVTTTGDETPQFQEVKGTDQFIVKTSTLDTEKRIALEDAFKEKFGVTTENIESQSFSATISGEMKRDAIISVLITSLCILIYITFRFKDLKLGLASIIALLHDIIIVFAVYAMFKIPINSSFIAAMLTILGYSINDTIVVFDRIRENQKHMKRGDYLGVVNSSVTQTLSRSINTSLTVVIMVVLLYFFGVQSMKQFALPLMVGMISGTYSSIFIASPLWYLFKKGDERKIKVAEQNAHLGGNDN